GLRRSCLASSVAMGVPSRIRLTRASDIGLYPSAGGWPSVKVSGRAEGWSELSAVGRILEARVLGKEDEIESPGRPVPVLADQEVGRADLTLGRTLLAGQEHDEVGILLEGARFAEVGQPR